MDIMSGLFRFPTSVERDPAIEVWMDDHPGELGTIARHWFEVMRGCGDDVRELLHDGHPTACIGDAAFAYVNAFKAHVNVGFFPWRRDWRSRAPVGRQWQVHSPRETQARKLRRCHGSNEANRTCIH